MKNITLAFFASLFISNMGLQAQVGASLNFDGIDDQVALGNFAINGAAARTVEFWMKTPNLGVFQNPFASGNPTNNETFNIKITPTGHLGFMGYFNDNYPSSGTIVADNTFHHVAITYDGTSVRAYIDGTLEWTFVTALNTTGTNNFVGKSNHAGFEQFFTGTIDELRVWSRCLCAAEIQNNRNCEISTTSPALLANFHFNQGIAGGSNTGVTTLTDASGNSYNGTLTNFALNGATSNWVAPGGVSSGTTCSNSFTASISASTNVTCFGGSNGSATVTANATYGAFTYAWTPSGGSGATAAGLTPGTYTCTISSACGSSITQTVTITQPASPVSGTTVTTSVACFGGSNGAINLTPSGGTGPYTFNWLPSGPTTEDRTALTSGTYSVQITDVNGCVTTVTASVTQPTALVLNANSQTNVSCFGGSNGAASVVPATGGAGGYTYNWTPGNPTGDGTVSVTGLTAGTWTCTVTDANSCVTTRTFNITAPSAIVVTPASQTNISCFGGSNGAASINTPTGGAGGYSYNWTPGNPTGDGTTSVTGLVAGTWTCTVTDANSCITTQTFNLTQSTAVVATISSQTNVACNGNSNGAATVTPSGGTAGYTFSWAPTGGNAATATGLSANCYTVTVTDANGCTATQTVCITQPIALSISTTVTNVSCNAGNDGSATVSVIGGTPSYSYAWAPSGGTAATASGLSAGTYTCTITDANGCTISQSVVLTEPTALSSTNSFTDITCFGLTNGSATVSPAGGTSPYTYAWSPSGGTSASATGLGAGMFTCTITDGAGCILSPTFLINEPSAISPNQMQNNITCNGGPNGHLMVSPSGGTGAYTYAWAPIANSSNVLNGSPAGFYTCTITDANGCTATATFNLTEPSALSAATMQTNVLCNGATTGDAMVMVTGGTSPYTYAWSSGGTAATESGLGAGSYTCTITDAFGCSMTQTFAITEPAALAVTTTQNNPVCNGTMTGNATVIVSGGTPSYNYAWSSGGNTATENNLGAGTYSCTITDGAGCSTVTTVTITEPSAISVNGGIVSTTCFASADGAINIMTTGGTPGYTWLWSNGATTESISAVPSGIYCVTVTDANGCTFSTCLSITSPALLTSSGLVTDASGCTTNDGAIDITVSGGTAAYTFTWSNSSTSEDVTGLDGGVYSVNITDANGCANAATFTITEPGAPTVTYSEPIDTACGGSLPTAAFTLSGESPAGGTWTGPGVSGNTFDASIANIGMNIIIYSYTDLSGCSGTASDSIYVDLCMDVNTIITNTFSVYPNPSTGKLNITTNGDNATIVVLDALGQQVMSVVSNSTITEVDLSKYADGLYFVRVVQNGMYTTQRVLIAR